MSTYTIDGMRVDDRFDPGNTFFVPNMQQYDMLIDTHTGQLRFSHDASARDYVQAQYNVGQGGNGAPALGTAAIVNITHRTAMQSADLFKHVTARRHLRGAGAVDAAYTFRDKEGNAYTYQETCSAYAYKQADKQADLYMEAGRRQVVLLR